MKARQIEKVIREKIADLAKAHPPIQNELLKCSIVTGGCITSMFLKEKVNDFDLYFEDFESMFRVMQYFAGKTNAKYLVAFRQEGQYIPPTKAHPEKDEDGRISYPHDTDDFAYRIMSAEDEDFIRKNGKHIEYVSLFYRSKGFWTIGQSEADEKAKKEPYHLCFASANAVTLSDKVQLVFRFFGPAAEIHKNYDFVHATNYWTRKEGLVTNTEALEAILARELIYKGSRFPLASIFRTRKFTHRGWTIHIGNYVKMAMQLNELDLTCLHTLREQLTGVDAAYLNDLIYQCEHSDEPITSSYVCELVDAIIHSGNMNADENEEKEMGIEPEGE